MSSVKRNFAAMMKECLKMFAVFFKIGLFSFGGGYAMLTMIEHEVVDKRGWLTHDELIDIFAIAESTPGAISINIATFIGTKRAGILGGIITTLGVVLPSFLVILALSYVIDLVRDNKWVNYLFMGVRVGVIVLIVNGAVKFLKGMKRTPLAILLAVAMFCLAVFTDISVIYLMLGSIGISVIAVSVGATVKKRSLISTVSKGAGEYRRTADDKGFCPPALLAVNISCDPSETDLPAQPANDAAEEAEQSETEETADERNGKAYGAEPADEIRGDTPLSARDADGNREADGKEDER